MTEEEKIERVARAIVRQYEIDDGFSEESAEQASRGEMWRNFAKMARAAIAAYLSALAEEGIIIQD